MQCETKYPILLVHGAGFRDRKQLGYWGRIPRALEQNGATLFYGHQDSWGSIEHNAATLKVNLQKILDELACDKVNIIAHSKGGLEARYMISSLGMAGHVASLTTIATPHNGSKTMDLLLRLPGRLYRIAAFFVNRFFRLLGDENPDFCAASRQFSTRFLREFADDNPDSPQVYGQSYAAVMKYTFSDVLLFWPNLIIRLIEGENDGLVTPDSARWAHFRGVLRGATWRGISHADVVDVRRMDFCKRHDSGGVCDIRAFYVSLVAELKQMGF